MSRGPVAFLKRDAIAHLLRAAAAITTEASFELVGTGAVIAQIRTLALDLTRTRELDLQLPDDERGRLVADLIDGSIGEGSQFDATFGYYAHALAEGTAQLPTSWRTRAKTVEISLGLSCVCPDPSDIALSKLAAWREKDIAWLRAAAPLILDLPAMRTRIAEMPPAAVKEELPRRLATLDFSAHRHPRTPQTPPRGPERER